MQTARISFVILILIVYGCAGVGQQGSAPSPAKIDTRSLLVADALSAPETAGDALTPDALQSLPVPAGVDAILWDRLTDELARVVASQPPLKAAPAPAWIGRGRRQAAATPGGMANRVDDLRLSGNGPYWLTWRYRNQGDYDLNGEVNISDLTPIALGFNATSAERSWVLHATADGDANGVVNIADITPIGMNFGSLLLGYKVYATNDLAEDWTYLGSANVNQHLYANTDRPFFKIYLESLDYAYYALWPYDDSPEEGGWSNVASQDSGELRRLLGVEGNV